MPSERSIFRKVQVILEYCQPNKHKSIEELVDLIERRAPASFVYHRFDVESEEVKTMASHNSIMHAIELAVELGLISETSGHLTKLGVSATDPRRFSRIIGNQTVELLKNKGLPLEKIEQTIFEKFLRSRPPLPPTVKRIWEALTTEVKIKDFASYLNILGITEILSVVQKRIYLPKK
jgi:hypothetical protein